MRLEIIYTVIIYTMNLICRSNVFYNKENLYVNFYNAIADTFNTKLFTFCRIIQWLVGKGRNHISAVIQR